jgi:hypothetical protein
MNSNTKKTGNRRVRMKVRIDTRLYTNLVLTVIAAVLVAGAAQQYGMSLLPSAQAQFAKRDVRDDLTRTATGVPIDTTIPQTQDVAVASATSEVAASNREIAAALKEVAAAIREGLGDIKTGMNRANGTIAPAGSAAPAAPAASSGTRPTVEVGP